MPVVTFSASGADNCFVTADACFVYATVDRRGFVMRAQCPHRGGPLHLSAPTADGSFLVCPWHERKTSVARLRAQIPAVRTGNRVTAVIPDAPAPKDSVSTEGSVTSETPVTLEYRPLSPRLVRPGAAV